MAQPREFTQVLRRRLAALSVVGVLMVALPLVQVLRFQAEQMETLVKQQASLDPVASAVHVQRGLLAHRELAGQVLRGHDAVESQRLQRQHDVSERAQALVNDLEIVQLPRARLEAQALRDDFAALATQVTTRHISPADSDSAHRLLVEQTLQVMDLADELGAQRVSAVHNPALRAAWTTLRSTPRRMAVLHAAAQNDEAAAQWQLFEQAHGQLKAALADATQRAQIQRAQFLALFAAMVLLAGGLATSLWRHLARMDQCERLQASALDSPGYAPSPPDGGPSHATGQLMQRLRDGDAPAAVAPRRTIWSDTAPLP